MEQSRGLQIFGLRNPEVATLMRRALEAESRGDFQRALTVLNEAQLIEPKAPDILQQKAEVSIELGHWNRAKTYVEQSIELGPRLGHLCQRNWRALAIVLRQMEEYPKADKAAARVPLCVRDHPARF